jgi:hypothetical protein
LFVIAVHGQRLIVVAVQDGDVVYGWSEVLYIDACRRERGEDGGRRKKERKRGETGEADGIAFLI